ncbi:hypothetical protein [Streptosporangium sp. NPDC020145]|uniref:hypothetical protein n=1 Tax=Streptosporangium sp. NPDC020145 TaxID=3154694 RepID=UPI003417A551
MAHTPPEHHPARRHRPALIAALNLDDSAEKQAGSAGVAVHAVARLLLIVTAGAGLAYRQADAKAPDRIGRERYAEPRGSVFTSAANARCVNTPRSWNSGGTMGRGRPVSSRNGLNMSAVNANSTSAPNVNTRRTNSRSGRPVSGLRR